MEVALFCQNPRCRKALDVHETLYELRPETFRSWGFTGPDYVASSQEEDNREQTRSQLLSRLWEAAGEVTGMDHPLCRECAQKHLRGLGKELEESVRDAEAYQRHLEALQNEKGTNTTTTPTTTNLEQEEKSLLRDLADLQARRAALQREMVRLGQEHEHIQSLQERYWHSVMSAQQDWEHFLREKHAVSATIEHAQQRLSQLAVTNIYNDAFHIWYNGHFGSINHFRLGRLPSQPVDWTEINAAWGQATALLHTIAKRTGFKFTGWKLVPMGSSSRMERVQDGSQYELHGSSDISLGRLFWYRRFDTAMVAFLFCVKEIADHCEQQRPEFRIPYRIEKDRIGEMSIKIQFNNEETWTKALKYLLTNLKHLLLETLVRQTP